MSCDKAAGSEFLFSQTLYDGWVEASMIARLAESGNDDVRHSFASGRLLVGKCLIGMYARMRHGPDHYAHFAIDPVKAAANCIANRIMEISG